MPFPPPASDHLKDDRSPLYVDVIVPRRLNRSFTYVVPSSLRREMAVGQRVVVPFGSATLHAIVVALCNHPPVGTPGIQLKEVLSLSKIDQSEETGSLQLHLTQWLSERYLAPQGQCVKLLLPPAASFKKPRTVYALTIQGQRAAAHSEHLPPGERKILQRLLRRPRGITLKTLQGPDPESSLQSRVALLGKGWIVECEMDKKTMYGPAMQQRQPGSPVEHVGRLPVSHVQGWNPQPQFLRELRRGLEAGSSPVVILQASSNDRLSSLIHGAGELLDRKRRVLVVAGEIDRAKEMVEALRNTNHMNIVLIHSGLSVRARAAAWQAAQADATDVVVGTRSSIFAPLRNIGLIWVEGEDSPALKEEHVPRYHARDVARHRATLEKAALVLASSHPSLECIRSVELDHANHVILPNQSPACKIEVIDLRDFPRGTLLTPPMLDGVRQAVASGSPVTLYLNRKGYASLLVCRACGQVPRCPSCSLALSFHKKASSLTCHSCGYVAALPEVCTACHAPRLEPVGAGTERIEESLRQCFPHVRIGRIDRDTIQRESQVDALGTLIRAGEIGIIIGTQMLFQRGRLPLSGFVGILNADASLHLPDFRSSEHTYQALQDAVALCRPGNEGKVIIQTILPDHHAIAAVVKRKPALFLRPELEFRRALDYPPFSHLVQLTISGRMEDRVKEVAGKWVSALHREIAAVPEKKDHREPAADGPATSAAPEPVTILGPTPAPIPRSRQRHHWHILVKSRGQEDVRRVVQATLLEMEQLSRRGDLKLTVDVDPISML
jgi:primosomal protein N' (replication factor Y)